MAAAVRTRKVSAVELVRASLARIESVNPAINACVDVLAEQALAQARGVDVLVARGEAGGLALAGVPVIVKDNLCVSAEAYCFAGAGEAKDGGRTTCGSRFLEQYKSPYTATAVMKLARAGAVVVAKANLDEFAMGSSGESSAFGPTRNPHDVERVPGGSSSGSAAAVAAGMVPLALGSDTGGSIRQPAGWCGVVGLKPTYGRVSRYGLVAYASSLDQVGPIAADVEDARLGLSVIAGRDELDATSVDGAEFGGDFEQAMAARPLVVGVPRQARSAANAACVTAGLEAALEKLRARGARVVEVDLPHADHAIAAYYVIAMAEASSNLARFDGVRYGRRAELKPGEGLMELYARSRSEGFGPEVQRRIMIGTYVLSAGYYDAYYVRALKARRLIADDYERCFAKDGASNRVGCDVLVMPCSPTAGWKIGDKSSDPLAVYLEDVYTVGVNLAGLPAMAVPSGGAGETPVGVQVVGPAWGEGLVMGVGRMIERAD